MLLLLQVKLELQSFKSKTYENVGSSTKTTTANRLTIIGRNPSNENIFLYLFFRVLASIVILGKACDLIDQHQEQKKASTASMSSASATPKKTSNNTNHATTTAEMSSTSPEAVQPQQPQLRPKIEKEKVQDEAAASSPPPLLRQPGSQVTSAEDISLLEAKLQRIDATRAFPNSPSAPVLAEVNRVDSSFFTFNFYFVFRITLTPSMKS